MGARRLAAFCGRVPHSSDHPDLAGNRYEKSQQRLTEMGFGHFMLQDLEDGQIKTFLERWHQETFTDDRDRQRKLAQLEEAIGKTRAIRELAGNPLLLTLMAILNRQQELPRDRARLYERSAQLLLLDWKTELLEERFPQLKRGWDWV